GEPRRAQAVFIWLSHRDDVDAVVSAVLSGQSAMQHSVCAKASARYSPALARGFSNTPAISLCPGWIAECRRCDPDCRFLFLSCQNENIAAAIFSCIFNPHEIA